MAVTLEAEVHKPEKLSSKLTFHTFYEALFPANTSATNNTITLALQQQAAGSLWLLVNI